MMRETSIGILILLFAVLLSACSSDGGPQVPPASLTSIAISPAAPAIAPGTITKLSAIGTYSNNSRPDITTSVVWGSSNTGVATISNATGSQGFVLATSATGTTLITATLAGVTGSTILTTASVTSIKVNPAGPPSIAPGTRLQYTATGTLSDTNSTQQNLTTFATWTSSDTGIANVSDTPGSKGLAIAVSPGSAVTATATITASYDGQSGVATFQTSSLDSITSSSTSTIIPKGTTQQFVATGTLADTTQQTLTTNAIWASSNTGVATISNAAGSKGLATAVNVGATIVLSSFSSITSDPVILTVTAPVLSSITVTPVNPSIALGQTEQFFAIGTFSDSSTQNLSSSSVTWISSDPTVATISNVTGSNGLATTVKTGSTTITATSGTISGSTTLTVTPIVLQSIEITPTSASIVTFSGIFSTPFAATGHFSDGSTQNLTTTVTWNSSLPNVATISNTPGFQGVATAVSSGTTDITATFSGLTSNTASLVVVTF